MLELRPNSMPSDTDTVNTRLGIAPFFDALAGPSSDAIEQLGDRIDSGPGRVLQQPIDRLRAVAHRDSTDAGSIGHLKVPVTVADQDCLLGRDPDFVEQLAQHLGVWFG